MQVSFTREISPASLKTAQMLRITYHVRSGYDERFRFAGEEENPDYILSGKA
jgi:hypothetical protein